jgi:hypothetical protein
MEQMSWADCLDRVNAGRGIEQIDPMPSYVLDVDFRRSL